MSHRIHSIVQLYVGIRKSVEFCWNPQNLLHISFTAHRPLLYKVRVAIMFLKALQDVYNCMAPLGKHSTVAKIWLRLRITGVAICFGLPSNYCTLLPLLQKISETNDTSFDSPIIEVFESGKKLGVASSWEWPRPSNWKSNTFTKTRLEPLMIELP